MIPPIILLFLELCILIDISIIAERSNQATFTVVKTKPDGCRVFVCVLTDVSISIQV